MGLHQLIPDVQDREFPSGAGHWTGDCVWEDGPFDGHQGFLIVDIATEGEEKQFQLEYPALKPPPDKTLYFYYSFTTSGGYGGAMNYWLNLFDGVNLLSPTGWYIQPYDPWLRVMVTFVTPPGWNRLNSLFLIKQALVSGPPIRFHWDNFSLEAYITEIPKIQYLPIMGVG
jgi:hypothetical protein